jgi:hypothetical protein
VNGCGGDEWGSRRMTAESDGGPNRNNVSMRWLTTVGEEIVPEQIYGGDRHGKKLRPATQRVSRHKRSTMRRGHLPSTVT